MKNQTPHLLKVLSFSICLLAFACGKPDDPTPTSTAKNTVSFKIDGVLKTLTVNTTTSKINTDDVKINADNNSNKGFSFVMSLLYTSQGAVFKETFRQLTSPSERPPLSSTNFVNSENFNGKPEDIVVMVFTNGTFEIKLSKFNATTAEGTFSGDATGSVNKKVYKITEGKFNYSL